MFEGILKSLKKLLYYFSFSCISAVLDFFLATLLYNQFSIHYIIANTFGIIFGFVIHFILSSKKVFKVKIDIKSFATYLLTFLIGLVLANLVLLISIETLKLNFNISKFLSMALPFFVTYFLRTTAYGFIERLNHDEQRV